MFGDSFMINFWWWFFFMIFHVNSILNMFFVNLVKLLISIISACCFPQIMLLKTPSTGTLAREWQVATIQNPFPVATLSVLRDPMRFPRCVIKHELWIRARLCEKLPSMLQPAAPGLVKELLFYAFPMHSPN